MSARAGPGVPVTVIGAGQAAAALAEALRRGGHRAPIEIVGDEETPPYERLELSKGYLSGKTDFDALARRGAAASRLDGVRLRLGVRAEALDPASGVARLSDGGETRPGVIVLATGGAARRLGDLPVLRDRADADRLRPLLRDGGPLHVIGGGWLGLEIAATAQSLGCAAHVHEAADRVLGRNLPPIASDAVAARHREAGVALHLGRAPDPGSLPQGRTVAAIGMRPRTELAEAAGIDCDDGILVDAAQRTSARGVFAIGDCARQRGQPRLESWADADASAERAAAAILGAPVPPPPVPWFFSRQHGVLIQMAGAVPDGATVIDRRIGGAHSLLFLDAQDRLGCAIGFDAARDVAAARRLMGRRIDRARARSEPLAKSVPGD